MRTSKSSPFAALVAVLCLSLLGATGVQAAQPHAAHGGPSLKLNAVKRAHRALAQLKHKHPVARSSVAVGDNYVDVDSRVTNGCGSVTVTSWMGGYCHNRFVRFYGPVPPKIWPRNGAATQYVAARWGMAHADGTKEWQPWRMANANRWGEQEVFLAVGTQIGTWWDFNTSQFLIHDTNALSWTVSGTRYQNMRHVPLLEVMWWGAGGWYADTMYVVPINGEKGVSAELRPDGYESSL